MGNLFYEQLQTQSEPDWFDALMWKPDDDRRVICVTETKKHNYNYVLGYYDNKRNIWVCGMNSNVILWCELPPLP